MSRPKEVRLDAAGEAVLRDRILETGVTLAQARRALKALRPSAHVLTKGEWENIPWLWKPGSRAPNRRDRPGYGSRLNPRRPQKPRCRR